MVSESPEASSLTELNLVIEDVVVLGKLIPKGTTILFPTVTGWEDQSNPVYGAQTISSASSSFAKDETIRRSDNLNGVRTDGALRKVGFWAADSGKEFIPERWLDGEGNFDPNAGPNGLPFSLGQRGCFGKNLAVRTLSIISFSGRTLMIILISYLKCGSSCVSSTKRSSSLL
jgi:hypothetical protein